LNKKEAIAKIITIVNGKAGVVKTTIAVNLAVNLTQN
jgi:cellulose biosynthesis protein BcsQ